MRDISKELGKLSPKQRELFEALLRQRQKQQDAQAAPGIPRRQGSGPVAASFSQQRLWVLNQLEGGSSSTYNIPVAVRLDGVVDLTAMELGLADLVRRHEALRTTFQQGEDDLPLQVVHPEGTVALPVIDLSGVPEATREAEARRVAAEEARRPFSLEQGPLFRTTLLRLSPERHVLLLSMHHIISDGWSTAVLAQEMAVLYSAHATRRAPVLPPLPVQYADYSVWQRDWMQGPVLKKQLDYWRGQLSGAAPTLALPTDRPRPAAQTFRGSAVRVELGNPLTQAIIALGQRHGATPFMVLLAAWQLLLSRYSGQEDISVGSPIAGRRGTELEGLIGFFVNTLVLRTQVSPAQSFPELLERVKRTTLAAYEHQDVPFERLVEELRPERSLSHSPLFQVMFVLQNTPGTEQRLPGLGLEVLRPEITATKFDLTLALAESPHGFSGILTYSTDLFDVSTVENMVGHYRVLLEALVAGVELPVAQLPLLTPAERQRLLTGWNDTATPFPEDQGAHQLIEAQARSAPDALAVIAGDTRLTRSQLDAKANALAHHLRSLGVGPESRVGLCVERSEDLVVGMLAIHKAGGAFVTLDPTYPADRLAFMVRDAAIEVVLTLSTLPESLLPSGPVRVLLDADSARIAANPSDAPPVTATVPAQLAYIIYTSGSTGRPKGTLLSHRGLVNTAVAAARAHGYHPEGRVLQFASPGFDAAVCEVFATLVAGATLVMAPRERLLPDAPLRALLDEHRITAVTLTPSVLARLEPRGLSSLETVICAGEALSPELVQAWAGRVRLLNAYGPTEVTVCASITREPLAANGTRAPDMGKPWPNTRLYVLNGAMELVPAGVAGELFIGGVGLARGYLGRADLSAEKFVPDPFGGTPGGRLYRSGDSVRWSADGTLEFLGRLDAQVKLRGFRVELGEVESALVAHAGVRQAAAIVRKDGSGDSRLVAYVVPQGDAAIDAASLRARLAEVLPDYMVPAAFVSLPALPLTAHGKLDVRALPVPGAESLARAAARAPETPTEKRVAALWSELLGVESITAADDFFALGGHSLLATQVVSRLRRELGVELPLRALFEAPTLAALAARVDGGTRPSASAPPLQPTSRDGHLPLSFAQQRLWFIDQFEPGSAAYNIPTAVLLEGDLRPELLQQALEALTSRHESLRTTFAALGEDSVQRILPRLDVALPLVDLSSLSASEQDAETRRLVSEEAQRPFNLAEGPLLRARLFRLAPERHVLVLTLHHIVSDGWSMGVLIRELGALYLSLTQGTPSPLAPLPIQYADFAAWQRGWLHGPVLQAQLDFWRHQLTGAPPVLELPTDRVRPAVQTYRGASLPFSIPQSLAARVNALAQRHGATPFMVLLASWQLLLSRYSGQDDISVGSPIAGRTRSELEGLIGFFVNTLVLRARIDSGASFLQLLAQVKQTTLGAYEHQDVPFEKLVEELRPQRSLSHTPLFQVMFSLQNTPQEALDLPRLALRPFALDSGVSKFDLSLSLTEGNGALEGVIDYSSDLFDAATVQRMAAHFQALLETIIANPERTVSSLSFLSGSERQQLLSAWNDTHQAFAWDGCLHERFEAQAARTPDALAVLSEETPLSFSALNQRANQWAGLLRQRGVRPEVRVALCFERSADMLVALLAVLKAGGSYLPIDPAYPAQRIGFMLQDAQPLLVLSQPHLVEALSSHGLEVLCLDDSAAASFPTANPAPLASADHPAYVIYTSGSTGKPKGVEVTQASVMNLRAALARTVYAGVTSPLRVSLNAPLAFDASVQQLVQLSDGHTLCVIPKDVREDVRLMVAWLERHQVQVLDCSPSHLRLLLDEGLGAQPMRVLVGGEAIDEALWARLSAHPRLQAFNVYGPTECTVDSTARAIRGAGPVPTLGGPLANARFYVLDAQLQPVPVGVPGELFIGGAGLARGYLRRPALTAERFIPDAFSDVPGARLYRTGDRVRWLANGELEYLGRIDFQVKLRGFRIELGEIEAALTEHTDVRESAVIVRKDGAAPQLVGYVVPAAGQALDVATLRTFLMERLPEYMVPSALVVLEALPLTTNGKLDRNALPAPHESGTRTHVPPREGTEQTLAGLFEDLLGVKPVGAHDDFFELGGHSLLATQLVSRIRSAFRVELPLRALFEMRTVSSLAAKLDSTSGQSALPPLKPAPAGQPLPQSSAQRRLWYVDRLAPGSAAYNIPAAVRVDGALDLAVMEQALRAVVSRQGALRTTFRNHEELPVQVLHPDVSFTLAVEDLTSLPESAREAQARTLANEEAHRPFDLERGPLFRARMLRLAPEHHVLLVTMHHIISDGWSIGVLVREVAAFYEARLRGGAPKLPELPVQYADFARWQHDWMQGPVLEAELDYWREQLAGAPTALELPTDRPRPAVQANRGSGLPVHLPLSVAQGVQALARRTGTTPFMVMLAAWQLLLSRYSGQEEVSVGSPVAGRNRSELEDLIGFFVNTVILRARLSPQLTVAELLTQVKQATLGATEHQDVPFEKLVEVLKPPRDTSRSPLFQVTFTLQNTPPVRMELPGLSLSVLDVEIETSKFDMSLVLGEGPDGVSGVLNYDTDLFDRATVARMMEHYRVLMEAFVVNEHARLSELSPLPASERQQVLLDWNATSADYPRDVPVHVRFAEQAARAPDAVALVFGDEQLTYGELDQRANQLAHHLRAYGVDAGTRVGLCLERSLELVVGLLGILKAGGAYVPVNRNYPAERISFLLQEAGVSVVVTLEELADELPAGGALFVCLDADEAMIARQPSDAPPAAKVGGDDLAYVMFTSGSTGVPKGVCIPHRGVVRLVSANPFIQFGPDEVFLQLAPVAFDASTLELWGALLHGARLVIAPPGTPSLNELGTLMEKQGVTTLWLTAALFEQAVLHMGPSLAQVRQVLAGGDVLPMQRVLQHLGRVPAGAVLVNGYGPTENTTFSATYTLRPGMPLAASVPIGRPLGHSTTYVLDAFLQPAPVGVPGELFVGGDGLAWGYLNRPDLTAEKFVPHPFSPTPGARLYRTGDRVRWLADGTLEFLGRTDFQVKVRGFRIELGEVESQLQRAPGVQEAVVVVREDVPGDKRLVAYLVGLDGPESVQPRALQDFLAQRLPDYMVPAAFVALEALPLNANGKVDRKALPAPDAEAREEGLPFEAPRTPAEEAVARVWSEVLGVKQVGIDDNYFDLGGDSMRSIQVIAKLREAGLELPMMALLQHPTIRELSTELKSTATVKPPVESSPFSLLSEEDRQRMPEGVEDAYPLTYLQSGMLFESVLHVGTGIYHDMFSLHLEMALDESRMRQALREVMSRHTILRTSFDLEGYSEPLQLVHGQVEPSLRFDDLRHLSKEEQDVFLREWAETYRRQNFDWTVAPLLHATVHRRTESTLQFTFLFHHAILDGWSATSVFTELVGRYLELLEGRDTPAEPPLTVTYRQFVALERDSLASGRDEKFWLDRMSEVEPPAARPPSQSGQADMMHRQKNSVSADLQERLQRVAQELGVSLKSVLLATHLRVASFVEGSNAVVTGLVSNGRPEVADGERMIGLFLNSVPFPLELSGGTWRELIREVSKREREVLPHRRYPMARLKKQLGGQPLFQTLFNFVHFHVMGDMMKRDGMRVVEEVNAAAWIEFPLNVSFSLDPATTALNFSVSSTGVTRDTAWVKNVSQYYLRALESLATNPDGRYDQATLLSQEEQQRLLRDWNATRQSFPWEGCLHERFEAQAARSPDALAVLSDEASYSFDALNQRANQWAWLLRQRGVRPEVRVALCFERSADMLVALFAILKAGGSYVPVDPAYPAQRIGFMLQDAQPLLVLSQPHLTESLAPHGFDVLCLDDAAASGFPTTNPPPLASAAHPAYVIYTSGSTGKPKGVEVTHASVMNLRGQLARAVYSGVTSPLRVSLNAPLSFDASVKQLVQISDGHTLCVIPKEMREDMRLMVAWLERHQLDVLDCSPSHLRLLLDEGLGSRPMHVLIGGEAIDDVLWARLTSHPQIQAFNVYGPTECTVDSTAKTVRGAGPHPSMGGPLANTRIYILDAHLNPVPANVPGELFIGGAGLARGYLNRPDLTAERFIPDAFSDEPGARLYRTGDRVRWLPDGEVEYVGRIDFQVKLRGFRIELSEIEAALRSHPDVDAAVVLVHDFSESDKRLVAYVVAGDSVDTDSLRVFLRERLPDFMVPALFVPLSAIPLTTNGKVDRRALPSPTASQLLDSRAFEAPRTPTEVRLASLWAQLLRVDQVGRTDDFFALGGHSLLATQVVSRLRKDAGIELPLRALFEAPTLAALASRIDASSRPSASAPPLLPTSREGHLPLSFAQQRLWFIDQLEPGSAVYNIPTAVLLEGTLQPDLLQQALEALTLRHESLRTTFAASGEDAFQRILAHLEVPLPLVDLGGLNPAAQDAETRRLVSEEAAHPFNLAEGPLLRARLFRLAPERHVLVLTLHHIVSDGWSMGVLIRELGALYLSLAQGTPSPLAPLPVQYADFAAWQRGWLHGPVLQAQLDFWRDQLEGAPPVLELPTDRARPAVQTYRGDSLSFDIPQSLASRINALAQRHGATPFMVLLASWQLLLSRYSGQDDISVGSPIAGRTRSELEGLIGFFVNTLVLRARIDSGASFLQLLAQVKQTTLGAYEHQDVPFEKLVEELRPQRSLSHSPLFQVMFSLQNTPQQALDLTSLSVRPLSFDSPLAKFDLTLALGESQGGYGGTLNYNTDLFAAETAQRMVAHFNALVEAVTTHPERSVSSLSFLSGSERQQLLSAWNDTHQAFAWDGCLQERFEAQAARTPDALAVLSDEVSLSFSALNQRANQWAGLLRQRGVRPEVRVALCFERSADMLVALLAVLKAGGSYLPIDPAYPAQRIGFMLQDAQPLLVLSQPRLAESLAPHGFEVLCLDDRAAADFPTENPSPLASADHPAYVIYTSGSTGKPKGVEVTHASVMNLRAALARTVYAGVTSPLRVSLNAPISFDASVQQLVQLSDGHALCVVPQAAREDASLLVEWTEKHHVDVLDCAPSHLRMLFDAGLGARSLRVLVGGEAIDDALWAQLSAHPRLQAFNVYGPTECTVDSTARAIRGAGARPTLGGPLANVRFYVLDSQLQPLPTGAPGELFIGGAGLARGYLNRPDLTAERFVPDPFASIPGRRMYRTGDRVRWLANGELEYLGRIDFQVKLRGFRIELGEIEAALLAHPDVNAAVVLVHAFSDSDKRLVAYVVAGDSVDTDSLRVFLRERLPDFMVPALFVSLATLPLTPNGKVDRKALPAPTTSQRSDSETFEAPRTPTEVRLASLWAQLLRVDKVGRGDDFFALGGHSLLATQVVSRVRKELGIELPLRALFEAPTLALLAARIDSGSRPSASAPPLLPVSREGQLPLSFAQQRLWFIDQLEPGSAAYNIPTAVLLEGDLQPALLQQALEALTLRHESLRTTFVAQSGDAAQHILPRIDVPLPLVDLSGLAQAEQDAQTRRLVSEEAQRPFDLAKGPLLRGRLFRLAPERHVLVLTLHHIVSDGWSMGVLIRELGALYLSLAQGTPSPLLPLPVQYADFAAWQRGWLHGPVLQAQLDFWRNQLTGAPPILELPTDRPRPAVQTYRGASLPFSIPQSLVSRVHALAQRHGATPFMVLLASWQLMLSRYSGQDDISVGSPIAGRTRSELEGLIGFFVNTLVLRARIDSGASFLQLLAQVKQTTLGAYEHQDVPFEKLVEELRPQRSLSHSPLFQVMFSLQNTPQEALDLTSLSVRPLSFDSPLAKFDLSLMVTEANGAFEGVLGYSSDLFDGATAQRMATHFHALIAAIVEHPERAVSSLSFLSGDERQQLLTEWNDLRTPLRRGLIHQRISEQAARTPEATALVVGTERLSYRELEARSNRLAHLLQSRGVGPDVRVAVCMTRSSELVVSLLAILKAGGAYVPLDPNYPRQRIDSTLSSATPRLLLSHQALLASLQVDFPAGSTVFLDALPSDFASLPTSAPATATVDDNLAYLIYTSGSTGKPKGVSISHASASSFLDWATRTFSPAQLAGTLAATSICFDLSVFELFAPLSCGGCVLLADDALALATLPASQEVTLLNTVPSAVAELLRLGAIPASVRTINLAGEPLPGTLARALYQSTSVQDVFNLYGPTEDTTYSTFTR
ncbi:non-ribosomal peptide synthase/polyketide synthase, partial [Comamonas sp. JC664]|uniref:non-ribosomal peptide synthase/polyketide synthase n=1 Tax=Comamonas sp. JC664 TaxID=2801917 RepID=UPI00174DBC56